MLVFPTMMAPAGEGEGFDMPWSVNTNAHVCQENKVLAKHWLQRGVATHLLTRRHSQSYDHECNETENYQATQCRFLCIAMRALMQSFWSAHAMPCMFPCSVASYAIRQDHSLSNTLAVTLAVILIQRSDH